MKDVNGRIILKWKEKVCEDVDWMYLAQERDQWRALVNMAGNITTS
jgi:hypothetical protein